MADRYWVDGTGNSNDTAHWSDSSGGAGGFSVPTSTDNAIFDTASSAANAAYTFTVNAAFACANFTMDGPDPTDTNKVTWAGSSAMSVYGNFNLSGGTAGITRTYSGTITFAGTSGTQTITTNSVSMANTIAFNGAGGTFQMVDKITNTANAPFQFTAGTFDANGQEVEIKGSSIAFSITTSPTFYDLKISPTTPAKTSAFTTGGSFTVSNLFTVESGATTSNRVYLKSNTKGTARTITAASTAISNADFMDITGAGAASWDLSAATGGSGDCGGNSGITFSTPTDIYYYKASGNDSWSTVANWFLGSGGTGGAGRIPLPQDTAKFDAGSFGAASMTVTQDMPRIGHVDWTGATNTPTWTTSTTCSVFGSITLISGMTLTASTQAYTIEGRGSNTIDCGGKTWEKLITVDMITGSLTLASDFTSGASRTLTLTSGTFDVGASNYIISVGAISIGANMIATLGSGTHLLTGAIFGSTITVASNATSFDMETSTFKITNTSSTAITLTLNSNNVFNNIWFSRGTSAANNTINANGCTFNDFKDDGSVAHNDIFQGNAVNFFNTFTVSGSAGQLITVKSSAASLRSIFISTGSNISRDYLSLESTLVGGTGTWTAGANSVFVSGNQGWTDQPATPTRYWVPGGDGNWSNTNNWSATDGGASGASVPTGDTDVFFNGNSGAGTSTIDASRQIKSLNFTGFTGELAGASSLSIYGSLIMSAGMTSSFTSEFDFYPSLESKTITTNGQTFARVDFTGPAPLNASITDLWTFQDNFTGTGALVCATGNLDLNDNNVQVNDFRIQNQSTRTISLGTGTITLTGTGSVWNYSSSSGITLNAETSTIKFTDTSATAKSFVGGSKTYNNFWYAPGTGTATLTITGDNTFNDFKDDGSVAHSILFTTGSTQTVTTFDVNGSAGQEITINSTTTGTHALVKAGGGTITCDYLNIQHSVATPDLTWLATNSTDNQAVATAGSGWYFDSFPAGGNTTNFFLIF